MFLTILRAPFSSHCHFFLSTRFVPEEFLVVLPGGTRPAIRKLHSCNTKITYRFSWLAMDSRSLTMVFCGSVGWMVEVADTVDVVGFLLPNKLLNILPFVYYSNAMLKNGDWGDLVPEWLSRSVIASRNARRKSEKCSFCRCGRAGVSGRAVRATFFGLVVRVVFKMPRISELILPAVTGHWQLASLAFKKIP